MEENPPEPFMLYTYDKNGVSYTKEGKLKFLFDSWFPNADKERLGLQLGIFYRMRKRRADFLFWEQENLKFS